MARYKKKWSGFVDITKLESSSNQVLIQEEVEILTQLLEEITQGLVGEDVYSKIKELTSSFCKMPRP